MGMKSLAAMLIDVMESLQVEHGNYPEMLMNLLLRQLPGAQFALYRCMEARSCLSHWMQCMCTLPVHANSA